MAATPTLWLRVGGEVSATVLSRLTGLTDLTLTFGSPPGVLTDVDDLVRHERLRAIRIDSGYRLDPQSLPDLPSLHARTLNGTRRATAAAVGARYRDSAVSVEVTGAKSESWLAAHMDNPFATGSMMASRSPRRRAPRTTGRSGPSKGAERTRPGGGGRTCAPRLTADLSAINDNYETIDTIRREQA